MFIDGVLHDDKRFQGDAEGLSKFFIAGVHKYQTDRPPEMQAGEVTAHVVLAALAFTAGVLMMKLPRKQRHRMREYLISKLDEMLKEHGSP